MAYINGKDTTALAITLKGDKSYVITSDGVDIASGTIVTSVG